MQLNKTSGKAFSLLVLLIIIIGIYLRLHQFLMGRSLWEDEAHMAVNFISRGYLGLMKPLDYVQAAPVLYLLTVKSCVLLFGYNEYAFRLLPLVLSIVTLPLLYYIILELTKSKLAAVTGLFTFSVNLAVIYFSSELKPYGVDVCVYLLLVFIAVSQHPYVARHRHVLLAVGGCVCMLYSNASFVVLFSIACYMLYCWYKNRKEGKQDIIVVMAWGLIFLVNYFLFIHHHPSAAQQKYNYAADFCPANVFSKAFADFFKTRYQDIFFDLMLYISGSYGFVYIVPFIFLLGIVHAIYTRRYAIIIFTCLPILVHLLLSAFKIYPFVYRLILYLVPAFIVLLSYGTYVIAVFLQRRLHIAVAAAFTLFCCYSFAAPSLQQYPLWFREVKPSLDYINKHYPQTDIYVTTPYTLYKYYNLAGYLKNNKYEGLEWNVSPAQYYALVDDEPGNYVLFHATDPKVDGYKAVMEDLRAKHLIVKEFEYMTYTVTELKPLRPHAADTNFRVIDERSLSSDKSFDLNSQHTFAIWSNEPLLVSTDLPAGYYKMTIVSKGTALGNVYPHLDIAVNGDSVGNYYTSADYAGSDLYFYQKKDGKTGISIHMDNDAQDLKKKEDRNAFIHKIYINKAKAGN